MIFKPFDDFPSSLFQMSAAVANPSPECSEEGGEDA